MKSLLKTITLLAIFFSMLACKKEKITDEQQQQEQEQQQDSVSEQDLTLIGQLNHLYDSLGQAFEVSDLMNFSQYGYEFSSSVPGLVTHLGHNIPLIGEYAVILWDIEAKAPLAILEVNQTSDNTSFNEWITKELEFPVAIKASKHYAITVLAAAKIYQSSDDIIANDLVLANYTIHQGLFSEGKDYPENVTNMLQGIPVLILQPYATDYSLSHALVEELPNGSSDIVVGDFNQPFNMGYEFEALSNGVITHLGHNLPNTGIYTVTLWEENGDNPLAKANVRKISSNIGVEYWAYSKLEVPVNIVKGKKYRIAVFIDANIKYYLIKQGVLDFNNVSLDFSDFSINQGIFGYTDGYPGESSNANFYGFPDFIFEK